MIFLNEYSGSYVKKTVFSCAILFTMLICINRLVGTGLQTLPIENSMRQWILIIYLALYFLRLQITVWTFQKRKWTWLETISISICVPFGLYVLTVWGENNHSPLGLMDIFGVMLYLSGSYINSRSEFSRHVWKKKKENRGRLYTQGLFQYSMHINYFGDVLLFFGFAMITQNAIALIVPTIMTLNFVFNIIPSLDGYLSRKYGNEFDAYEKKTKKLIPYIY